MVNLQDDLVDYYRREMSYLRESGDHFAQRYPKVAQRLSFNGSESKDPHTERLLESFAFLTARVQREIDREFPMAAMAVLENICPNLTQPSIDERGAYAIGCHTGQSHGWLESSARNHAPSNRLVWPYLSFSDILGH